ncbi:MAG: hypothetical protein Kow0029_16190 [Candidatus Rifleibacteriota bacterium]
MRTTISIILAVFIILTCMSMATGYKSAAVRAELRKCQSNMKELQYALDTASEKEIKSLVENGAVVWHELVLRQKVAEVLKCPFGGKYCVTTDGKNIVYCSFHGCPENQISGRLDPGYSLIYWFNKWVQGIFS